MCYLVQPHGDFFAWVALSVATDMTRVSPATTHLTKVKTSKQVQDEWPTYTIQGHTGSVAPKILETVNASSPTHHHMHHPHPRIITLPCA